MLDLLSAGGYEAMLDVLGLSGLQKVTARLIEGIEVKQVGVLVHTLLWMYNKCIVIMHALSGCWTLGGHPQQ